MPLCCFPAVLLVQGIIAKMEKRNCCTEQCHAWTGTHCWSGSLGQRHLKGSAKVLWSTCLVGYTRHDTDSLLLFTYFVYLRYPHPHYLWSADKFLSEIKLGVGDTFQLTFGGEMLFLSKNSNFPVSGTLKQQRVRPTSTVRATSKVFFMLSCKLGKICGPCQTNCSMELKGRLLVTTDQRHTDLVQ